MRTVMMHRHDTNKSKCMQFGITQIMLCSMLYCFCLWFSLVCFCTYMHTLACVDFVHICCCAISVSMHDIVVHTHTVVYICQTADILAIEVLIRLIGHFSDDNDETGWRTKKRCNNMQNMMRPWWPEIASFDFLKGIQSLSCVTHLRSEPQHWIHHES